MGQKKVWLLAGGVGAFVLLLQLALGGAVTALIFQQPDSRTPAVEPTPTPTSEWTKPNRTSSNSDHTETQPRSSPSPSTATPSAPRPTRDAAAAAAAQLQAMRAECQARNTARDAEVATKLAEIQQLEAALPGYESELAAVTAIVNSPEYWNYDFTARQQLANRQSSLTGTVGSTRADIDYKYSEIRLLATAYEDCIY